MRDFVLALVTALVIWVRYAGIPVLVMELRVLAVLAPTPDPSPVVTAPRGPFGGEGKESGVCLHYAAGVMERVAEYRGLECHEGVVGCVAMLECRRLGELVMVNGVGPYRVADCAQAEHRDALARRGIVAEVDYPTALRWGMAGPVACEVGLPRGGDNGD